MKKKILILANNASGLYDFRNELLLELLKIYEVHVSIPDEKEIPQLEEEGCILHHTNLDRRGINPVKDLGLIFAYIKLIRRIDPGVVLTYTIKPNIYGGLCCRILKIPYLTNITGLGSAFEHNGIVKKIVIFLYQQALKKASCVFFQNKKNQQLFEDYKIKGKKSALLPGSGVNLLRHSKEEYPPKEEKIRLTFVGRMMREKGMDELLYTIEKICAEDSGVIFEIVGNYEEDYEKQVERLVEKGYLILNGYQKEIHPYYKKCHGIIMPSYHEGMNNVILEASATGRPVLASNIPGCREGFAEGITGYGFGPRDKEGLYKVVKKFLLLSYEEKREMGKRAREKMEREFDRNLVVKKYREEIHAILERQS